MNVAVLNSFLITMKESFNESCHCICMGLALLLQKTVEKVLHTSRNLCMLTFLDRDDLSEWTGKGRGLKTNALE